MKIWINEFVLQSCVGMLDLHLRYTLNEAHYLQARNAVDYLEATLREERDKYAQSKLELPPEPEDMFDSIKI